MNYQIARPHLPALLDPRLADSVPPEVRAYVATCPDCQRELAELRLTLDQLDALPAPKPSPRLRANFYAMLDEEKRTQRAAASPAPAATRTPEKKPLTHRVWFWLLQPVAACALLALGFLAGQRHTPPPAAPVQDIATQREIAELRAKVDGMGQLVSYSLTNGSSNDRLQGVMAAQMIKTPDDGVLTSLINTLALDPSTNVRLSALDALYPHANQDVVRAAVLASLAKEQSPLVQVAMIDFLVSARDREASSELQRIVNTETTDRSVREAARRALTQL